MVRPCFLVVDRETSTGISTRKLVIETAKFNVITAYSSDEAIEVVRKFPAIDGVVTDSGMTDMPCHDLVLALKAIKPGLLVVVVAAPRHGPCDSADHMLQSFDPKELLALLQRLHPEASRAIEERNEDLEERYYNP